MQVEQLKDVIEREPFRPFVVRLTNGAQYSFETRRDVGAWKDYSVIFHFGEHRGSARIDVDSIVEIIEK